MNWLYPSHADRIEEARTVLQAICEENDEKFAGILFTLDGSNLSSNMESITFYFGPTYLSETSAIAYWNINSGYEEEPGLFAANQTATKNTFSINLPADGLIEGSTYKHFVNFTLSGNDNIISTEKIDTSSWSSAVICPNSSIQKMHTLVTPPGIEDENEYQTYSSSTYNHLIILIAVVVVIILSILLIASMLKAFRHNRIKREKDMEEFDTVFFAQDDEFSTVPASPIYKPKEANQSALNRVLQITQGGRRRTMAVTNSEKARLRDDYYDDNDDEVVV